MKLKVITIFLALATITVFIFKSKTQVINNQISQRTFEIKKQNSSLTLSQKKSVYYMLAYNYKNPIKTGKVIFESKNRNDYYKKNNPLFDVQTKIKYKFDNPEFNNNISTLIKSNTYLNDNLQEHLKNFIFHLEVIQSIPSSYFSTQHLNLYLFKAIKYNTNLVVYNYSVNKRDQQINRLHQAISQLFIKGDSSVQSALFRVANLKPLHLFIKKNNILDTSSIDKQLRKLDTREVHQKILLNGLSETHQFINKYSTNNQYTVYRTFGFIKKSKTLANVYTRVLNFFFSTEQMINLAFKTVNSDINLCFDDYNKCINKNLTHKRKVLKLSHLDAFTSLLIPNLKKLRLQTKAMAEDIN